MSAKKQQLLTAQAADFVSVPVDLQSYSSFSAQVGAIGSIDFASTVTLQVSNDFDNWIDVTGTAQSLSGLSDVQMYDVVQTAVSFVRVKLTISAGSADFDIDWMLK